MVEYKEVAYHQFTTKTLRDMLNRAKFKNVFPTGYKDLSMLVIPLLKHLKVYE